MPNGLTEEGTKVAAETFYENLAFYPYKIYINWRPQDRGNILYNDKKFVSILYELNGAEFTDYSKVSDVSSYVKGGIYDFIEDGDKIVVLVDCENSDPFKLSATLRSLDSSYTQKISSIILFDDVHTSTAWDILHQYTNVTIEHVMTHRIKGSKSIVDMKLAMRASKEYYDNSVDSFIIVSSDSDYWAMIEELPNARFLVMIERENCGPDLKKALANSGIFYCYIDDFYSGNADDVKHRALFSAMYQYIDNAVRLNVNEMFSDALTKTRVEMSQEEKKQFFSKFIKTMQMSINSNGDVEIEFKKAY